mgnify:CR=1 FL=1
MNLPGVEVVSKKENSYKAIKSIARTFVISDYC